jgi:hypothetical protein
VSDVQNSPELADQWYEEGLKRADGGDYTGAIEAFNNVLGCLGDQAASAKPVYWNIGMAMLAQAGDDESGQQEAIAYLGQCGWSFDTVRESVESGSPPL